MNAFKNRASLIFQLFVLFSLFSIRAIAQCSSCTLILSGGSSSINATANYVIYITGTYSGQINFNGSNVTVCISSSGTWSPSSYNLNQNPTINIFGTLNLGNNISNTSQFNIKDGGNLNLHNSSTTTLQSGASITVEDGGTLEVNGKLNITSSTSILTIDDGGTANLNSLDRSIGLENNQS